MGYRIKSISHLLVFFGVSLFVGERALGEGPQLQSSAAKGCFIETQKSPPATIPLPCLTESQMKSARLDLQACSVLLSPESSHGLYKPFYQFFSDRISCFYQGYLTTAISSSCQSGVPLGSPRKIICSINDGEDGTNHLGESCGSPTTMDGKWEYSQILGLWIQAVKYFRNEVWQKEILAAGALKIHPACQPMAVDFMNLNSTARCLSNGITANIQKLPTQVYTGDVNFCAPDVPDLKVSINLAEGGTQSVELSNAIPKIAACTLGSSRSNRIGLFSAIAQCEVWTRLDDFFSIFVGQKSLELSRIVSECADKAIEHGHKVGLATLSRSSGEAAGKRYFQDCYTPRVKQFFKDTVNQLIPGHFQSSIRWESTGSDTKAVA